MHLGHHTITWGGVVGDATGVTSVKDLFYRTDGSMEQAFRDIAAAGYEGTEMFDGNLADSRTARGVRDLLAETGLSLVSVYTGANFIYDEILPDELHRVQRACELAAGRRRPAARRRRRGTARARHDRPGLRPARRALDRVVDLAEDAGLSATYHPHLTTIVECPTSSNACCRRPGSASAPTPPTSPPAVATRPR